MDTTSHAGNAGRNEQERKDQREWGNELKKAREALAEGRRREEELEGVVRERKKAMRELEEWIGRKVDAMSSLATVLREGWLREAVLSQAEGARKRARMMDGSPSHPVIMMEHLTALNGHAEAFRSMVQAVRMLSFGLENRNSHAGRMTEEKEGEATSEAAQNKAHADRMKEGKEEDGGDQWAMEIEEGEGEEAQEEGGKGWRKGQGKGWRKGWRKGQGKGQGNGQGKRQSKGQRKGGSGSQRKGQSEGRGGATGRCGLTPLITAARTAGSRGGASVDSGGAVTNVEDRPAHKGGGNRTAGRAGGPPVGRLYQWPAGRVASEAEVRARLQRRIDDLQRRSIHPDRMENTTRDINRVVSQLWNHPDPAAKELSLSSLSLACYLFLTPHCYPGLLPSVTTLNLQKLHPVSPCAVNLLLRMPSLTALHLHETSVRSDALPLFPHMSRLQRLVIACADPSIVLNLPASRQGNLPAPSDPISTIQPFQRLRELHVSRVTDSTLQFVGMLASLEVFSCTYSKGMTSQGWNRLRRLQNLKRLLLAPSIKDWGSNDQIPATSLLQSLLLRRFNLSLDFSLSRLPKIIHTFQRPPKNRAAATSEDPSDEPKNRLDASIWDVVAALPRLQHLEIHAAEPSATALRSLSTTTHLKTLCITGTALDDSDLVGSSGLSLLTDLSLAACTFTVAEAVRSVIRGMTQLKSLDLSGTAITQGATVHLQALERLERLKLQQCSGMRKEEGGKA
ncbi:unnamed protein product [Closterium sp. NIES-64]|nr:unnamed protein product [Closterium sp. NIES-64]